MSLTAKCHVFVQTAPGKAGDRGLRRPYLCDSTTGVPLELYNAFLYSEHSGKLLGTKLLIFGDLALFHEWTLYKVATDPDFIPPETRIANKQLPLSKAEITDLSGWTSSRSSALVEANNFARSKSRGPLTAPMPVSGSIKNRRLTNIQRYLSWCVDELCSGNISDSDLLRTVTYKEFLASCFNGQRSASSGAPSIRSLDEDQSKALRAKTLLHRQSKSKTSIRDALIIDLYLDAGLRAGELAKLCTVDVSDSILLSNVPRGVVSVVVRRDDIADERIIEPAAKTGPGAVIISRKLASRLINYCLDERAQAIYCFDAEKATPYLFVNHSGKFKGKATSLRNIRRIVSKFQLSAHVLRHTALNETAHFAKLSGSSAVEIRALLISKGRWHGITSMPELYTAREIKDQTAAAVDARDKHIERQG